MELGGGRGIGELGRGRVGVGVGRRGKMGREVVGIW